MSASENQNGAPIVPGSPLARALDAYGVPELSPDFAERVLAAAATRPAATLPPLPELRRSGGGGARGWRLGRRIALATVGFSALATAAAATGLLERVGLPVPSAEKVWASITGKEAASAPASAPAVSAPADPAPAALAPVRIEGPIDTPEELGEAFRRIDEVRAGRAETRRQIIDLRIDRALERRREAGLPLPTPEEEARLRERIEQVLVRREGMAAERIEARREELRGRVENGEALTREDIVRPLREEQRMLQQRQRIERFRQMSPAERREALRQLPPEERRALIDTWRERREQRLGGTPEGDGAAAPAPEGTVSEAPAQESPQPLSRPDTSAPEAPL